jgi:hypothetical protein
VLYAFLRALDLAPLAAGAGVALFLGSGLTIRMLTTPTYVDPLSYLANLACFYFLATRREALFSGALTLGTLNRETSLFLVPVYLLQLRSAGRLGRRDLPRVALVVGVPLLTLGLAATIRLLAAGALEHGLNLPPPRPRTFEQNVPSPQDLAEIYSLFGAGWLLALLSLRQAPLLLWHGLTLGALLMLQFTISRGDESRNLSHLLPVVLPLAALQFRGRSGWQSAVLLAASLLSMLNFRWVVLPGAAVRYLLVAFGSIGALAMATIWREPPRKVHSPAHVLRKAIDEPARPHG